MSSPLPDDDTDLRHVFQAQRRLDHADAPVWQDAWLRPSAKQRRVAVVRWSWLPTALGVACAALALGFYLYPQSTVVPPPLTVELPALFDEAPAQELFASLELDAMTWEQPSDFLLPTHLR